MHNSWTDSRTFDEREYTPSRGRNPDSSVAAQYEDSVLPDPDADSDSADEYEPS